MAETLYMETTKIPVMKTCAQIEEILQKRGVSEVWKKFENGHIEAIEFLMKIGDDEIPFKLPMRWQTIQELARRRKTRHKKTANEDQARKIAARLILRWIEAQFALIDTGMVEMQEVFLPYVLAGSGQTFYQHLKSQGGLKALQSPGKGENNE